MSELPLKDRIALVVGASRGRGYESALARAKAGAHVVATARTQGGLEELDDAIFAATGKHATLVPFDLVDGGGIDRLGGAIFERFKKLDIWVHAAATMGPSGLTPVSHADPREFAKIEKTNFTAVYRLIRSLEPLLRASDAASVVLISSVSGREVDMFAEPYGVLKAALSHYGKTLSARHAVDGVRVNTVSPGNVYFADGVWGQIERDTPDTFAACLAANPLGRMATPEEVARATVFLASPAASFSTGTNLLVDGGLTRGVQF